MRILPSTIVLGTLASIFVLHPFTPNFPASGMDPSWVAVTGEAADGGSRWGVDTIFIYGPAAPLATNAFNAAYFTLTLPLLIGFAALFGWCAALLVARGPRPAVATVFCGLAIVSASERTDAFYLTLPFLVFLLAVERDPGRGTRTATLLGAFAMGLTAMVKVSFPLAALPLFALADGAALARRRWPTLLPVFGLGIVAGALLYGQRLSDLGAYAASQREMVAGYGAAMGKAGATSDLALFLLAAAGLVALATRACRQGDQPRGAAAWLVPAGLAIDLLFLFKAGFVRHDLHSLTAWTGLVVVGTVLAWSRLPRRAGLAVTALACGLALVYQPYLRVRPSPSGERLAALERLYRGWLVGLPTLELGDAARALSDPQAFGDAMRSAKAENWLEIARAAPIAALDGTVDVLPSQQSRVLAAGLDYRARPSFQEYATYTAGLEAANQAFLEGPRAPRWVLFGPESAYGGMTIDGRFPNFAEGALWLDLLRLYRPDHRIGALAALRRRDAPAAVTLGPPRTETVGFDAFSPVDGGPVWARIALRLNPLGRLAELVFRAPAVTLVARVDGVERRYRMVPALAEAGFLLSPIVDNASDFEMLARRCPAGPASRVTAVSIEGSRAARAFYEPDIVLTTRAVDLSGLAASDSGDSAEAARPGVTPWDALVQAHAAAGGGNAAENGTIQAPAGPDGLLNLPLIDVPVRDGRRIVSLGYGLTEDAPPGTPVCFRIHPADGTLDTPWHRCLDPADRVRHGVTLEMSESVTELALETSSVDDLTAYWARPDGAHDASP